ncbi:MAG TPA: hypothetical protein VF027_06665 [Sphingomicrobium sp.]
MRNLIDKRVANALFADATLRKVKLSEDASEFADRSIELADRTLDLGLGTVADGVKTGWAAAERVLAAYADHYGGLWVGGTATLTADALAFEPNAMNRLVHENGASLTLDLPLAAIDDVVARGGFVTGIIDVIADGTSFSIRCFKSKPFAETIRSAIAAAAPGSALR